MTDRPRGVTLEVIPRLDTLPEAIGTAPDGTKYVICTEGVGWKLDKLVTEYPEYAGVEPTGQTVDLADWIRTFGARLEDNFWLWHHRLTTE